MTKSELLGYVFGFLPHCCGEPPHCVSHHEEVEMQKYDRTGIGSPEDYSRSGPEWPISEWELREELADLFERRGLILERAVHSGLGQEYVIQYSEAPQRKNPYEASPKAFELSVDILQAIEVATRNEQGKQLLEDILDRVA